MASVRSLFFNRMLLNLALLLGVMQLLIWHWVSVVWLRQPAPGWLAAFGLLALLVVLNGLAVPALRRARRRRGVSGKLARLYMNAGVATLLVGVSVATIWLAFGLFAGLLGAVGADPSFAFESFRAASALFAGSVAAYLLWGFSFGQSRVARTRVRVALPGLSPALAGLRVVQISDLHIGNGLEGKRLSRMLERSNALEPDLIVITGDIFDFDPAFIEDGVRRLAGLRARLGVYAILGNHDVYTGTQKVVDGFARLAPGIRLLRNESVRLPLAEPLYLAGVEDPGQDWSARRLELPAIEKLAEERPSDGPTLLLVHRPEAFPQAARLGFPLVLAGHTHGGQLALPTPGGPWNLARIVTRFTRGVYKMGDSTLYVTRGIGVGGPALRVNCSREITTVELNPAAPRRARGSFPVRPPAGVA
jgi:predicted MPP superfamily phosphohydrolase